MAFSMPWKASLFEASRVSEGKQMLRVLLTLPYGIHLLHREVVEAPIGLVDSNAEWPAMTPVVLFGKLRNRYALFVLLDSIPQAMLTSVETQV